MSEEYELSRNANYVTTNNASINTNHRLILPYKGEEGQKIVKPVNNYLKNVLSENHAAQHIYKRSNWGLHLI